MTNSQTTTTTQLSSDLMTTVSIRPRDQDSFVSNGSSTASSSRRSELSYSTSSQASSCDSLPAQSPATYPPQPTSSARHIRRSITALAKERTSTALANLASITASSNNVLRSVASSSSLSKEARVTVRSVAAEDRHSSNRASVATAIADEEVYTSAPSTPTTASTPLIKPTLSKSSSPTPASPSQGTYHKMHQTSSRLLRMTDDERPFTRDFKDLFSTLMVSLPLTPHRVRFSKMEHTFSSEEAINNLGSLKFSQSNRMPDPKDPSRIVTTTTTTTFSMAKEMARSVCQRFMEARFIEPADGRPIPTFPLKGAVWQMTPKGVHVLHRFCQRNGINASHIMPILARDQMQLVILERDTQTDKLDLTRGSAEVIFRRFAGQYGPNVKSTTSSADTDSLSEYNTGMVGVKVAKERKIFDRVVANTFTGKAATDWLMDCCTTIDRKETYDMVASFVKHGLIWAVVEDKVYMHQNPNATVYQPTKTAIYAVTDRGQRIAGWITRERSSGSNDARETRPDANRGVAPRDSNNNRLNTILQDPALRLLFREFLRFSLCEENLSFYLEIKEFTENYHQQDKAKAFLRPDAVRDTLAAAYGMYNAFLAPGSPCELNIDHSLRNSLASRMTRAVGDEDSMLKSLREVVELFEMAQNSVFKLMSSDSVPKFVKDPRYVNVLREHNIDLGISGGRSYSPAPVVPERSMSRSARQ